MLIQSYEPCIAITQMDIADRLIQVGGAREGQSFVLKV
jgi:hypothetical protein